MFFVFFVFSMIGLDNNKNKKMIIVLINFVYRGLHPLMITQ